ncbi:MAG: hypothetical protein KTR32_20705 [Granulosicoccus sp.]|nr:hypothetical protein [Granulosicoccus sp.]
MPEIATKNIQVFYNNACPVSRAGIESQQNRSIAKFPQPDTEVSSRVL